MHRPMSEEELTTWKGRYPPRFTDEEMVRLFADLTYKNKRIKDLEEVVRSYQRERLDR